MTPETQKYLRNFYRPHNEALVKLLSRLGYTTPDWLEEDLKDGKDDTKLDGSEEKDTKQGSWWNAMQLNPRKSIGDNMT